MTQAAKKSSTEQMSYMAKDEEQEEKKLNRR